MMIYEFIKDIDYLRIYLVVLIVILVIRGANAGYRGLIAASEKDLLFLIIAPLLWPLHCLVFIGAFIRGVVMKESLVKISDEYDEYELNKLGEYSGEPFYITKEIYQHHYIDNSNHKVFQDGIWKRSSLLRDNDLIRLNKFNAFYETDLFANAKKPDANHPCRGDER